MFDLNGDGNVDAEEFDRVTELMKQHSSTGARHRDHGNTGSSYKGVCSGLKTYFFGDDLQGNLTVDRWVCLSFTIFDIGEWSQKWQQAMKQYCNQIQVKSK